MVAKVDAGCLSLSLLLPFEIVCLRNLELANSIQLGLADQDVMGIISPSVAGSRATDIQLYLAFTQVLQS